MNGGKKKKKKKKNKKSQNGGSSAEAKAQSNVTPCIAVHCVAGTCLRLIFAFGVLVPTTSTLSTGGSFVNVRSFVVLHRAWPCTSDGGIGSHGRRSLRHTSSEIDSR